MSWLRKHLVLGSTLAVIAALLLWWLVSYIRDPNGGSINEMQREESVQLASGETVRIRRHVLFRQEGTIAHGISAPVYESASVVISRRIVILIR
jgi:hypothetical protein